ncbi:hypothetical protein [Timonella sp. A28]|uniref:hypothetical protein n=1 Tax=Timonella sp. A28 TaxID=3442640 RepID=UPI003EC14B9B
MTQIFLPTQRSELTISYNHVLPQSDSGQHTNAHDDGIEAVTCANTTGVAYARRLKNTA